MTTSEPIPTAAPPSLRRRDDGDVAILELACPDRTMNVVDEQVLAELADHHAAVLADDTIAAMVLTSARDGSFGAGADVEWLPELAARDDADVFLADVHELMVALVGSPKPMVTALNGPAFGGALELALGGAAIVAVPEARLGLPEVTLALLPGGGGTQLLGRFVGPADAVALLTTGRAVTAEEAHDLGLVSELAAPDDLVEEAVALARALASGERSSPAGTQPYDGVGADEVAPTVQRRRDELREGRMGLSPAADRILSAVAVGAAEGLQAGLAAEREHFLAALRAPEARAALHLFRAERDVKRRSRGGGPGVTALGIVGGGQMGAGIAATAVSRGLGATIQDVSDESLQRAATYRDKVLARSAPDDSGDPDERADAWRATTTWEGFGAAEAVIEAVFEDPDLKTTILADVASRVDDDTLLATNTSAIPIASLASAVPEPGRFLGMHFFSPVDRMPLVELIPHDGTTPGTRERAAALGRRLGKVPVVVGDAPGFFTSRVYARWLVEGVRLLLDGVSIDDVEDAATSVGFPVGPLRAHDEATITLVVQASITQVAEQVLADRIVVPRVRAALESLVEAGITGRRGGRGFFAYEDGRRTGPNPEVADVLGVRPERHDHAEVADRLLYAFATECFACWDDGTLCHPDDGDVASVLGIGFPRVLGGPFHWAGEVGAADVLARAEALGATAFPTGESLPRLADSGATFTDEPRRPAPFHPAGHA